MMEYYTDFDTPFCRIVLVGTAEAITGLYLATGEGDRQFVIRDCWQRSDAELRYARREVEEYCRGNLRQFTVSGRPQGTTFQRNVWQALCRIPYGEVRSYKEIAVEIGNPGGARAVGQANSRNPIPLIIPCHRVVAADGGLGGFAHGLQIKAHLLEMERSRG